MKIKMYQVDALIITAKGNDVDFVSRFFAPQSGINEDGEPFPRQEDKYGRMD